MLSDIPIGKILNIRCEEDSDPLKVLCCFTVFGFLLGLSALLVAWVLFRVAGPAAGAIISGAVLTAAYEVSGSGRNMAMCASLTDSMISGMPCTESLLNMDDDFHSARNLGGTAASVSTFVIRMLAVSFLVYSGGFYWLVVIPTLSFTFQSALVLLPGRDSAAFIELDNDKGGLCPWVVCFVLCFAVGILHPGPVFLAFSVAALLAFAARRFFIEKTGGITGGLIGLAGYSIEILFLLFALTVR
jgi:cobalamin synthase